MLRIGKTYIVRADGTSRLCADLTIGNRQTTLWFGVESGQEEWLAPGRSDAFVVALLPSAMRGGHEIVCEAPMSERLHYQLTNDLIPALAFAGELYHIIKISAPLTAEKLPNQGAVGTGFTGGVDSLYTIMRHGEDCEYPLTHLAVFNPGYMESKETFWRLFHRAEAFGAEQGLQALFVDTNFGDILPEIYSDVCTFRNLACALALGRLFSIYLLSSGPDGSKLDLDLSTRRCSRYDLLAAACISTKNMPFYLSGAETTRVGKLAALTRWEPSRRWLNPCTGNIGQTMNCGHCRKCIQDMTILYGLGELENYGAVYDTVDFLRNLPKRIGFVLAKQMRGSNSGDQTLQLLEERQVPIPPAAYIYEKQFRLAMRNLKTSQKGEKTQ